MSFCDRVFSKQSGAAGRGAVKSGSKCDINRRRGTRTGQFSMMILRSIADGLVMKAGWE
jgi:hypothetical protein